MMPVKEAAARALGWLGAIVDDQGQIPLLNDAAYGITSPYRELLSYAHLLGVAPDFQNIPKIKIGPWSGRNLSGYLSIGHGPFRVLWDTAPLGPDHLLGHAHCDMLSVLLDFWGQSILTDTGVSQYDESKQRLYERGTAAHNTVVLDGLDQADIWKAFRVGRRGYPKDFKIEGQRMRCSQSQAFFDDLKIRQPNYYLGVGSGSHAVQTAQIMIAFEEVCLNERPDVVAVVGDVNSTVACALVAKKLGNQSKALREAGWRKSTFDHAGRNKSHGNRCVCGLPFCFGAQRHQFEEGGEA